MQRLAGLTQREVERGRLERPHAIELRDLALWRLGEQLERRDVLGERADRPVADERQRRSRLLQDLLVDGVVDDVLAEALLTSALEVEDRRLALEVAGHGLDQCFELVALDPNRQICDQVVGAHGNRG